MTNWIEKYQAGKIFLQPNSSKLPGGYKIPYKDRSSELAISIGGENGEPAYLIPSFKYGIPLSNPIKEFNKTGEHLGGPFKTWQEADKWGKEIRHPYVEKGQPIPSPIRTWGKEFQNGGSVSSSRKDYLRQQHQNYLKSQAEKGRKAVTDATDKFSRDYVIPAIKTVGSFTPAGFFIGLADAYEAYQQGNTGWALAGAGMEALPYVGKGIGKGVKALSNTLIDNKDAIKLAYYNKAPWTWKPNPNYYYRAGKGSEFLDDVIERNEIRAFNPNSYVYLRDQGLINGIRDINTGKITIKAKTFPIADTYWSKGVPLDGRYTNQNYGDHIIEASDDIPFVNSVNQRTKQKGFWDSPDINYNSTHVRGSYVKPRQSYGYDEKGEIQSSIGTPLLYDANKIKLYKPHWLKGYKEIPKKGKGGFIPIAQEGVSIRSDDRNWLERFNDKVYSGYQEHKPQLFKDFPITDIVEPVVSYLTGHADAEYGPLIAFTPSMGKMIAKPSKDFNNLYHYSRNPFLDYEDVNLFREGSSQMKGKYRHQANSPEDLPGGFYTTMNPRDGFMGGKYGNKMSIPANAKVKDLAITGRMTDRIPIKELKQFRSEGYDIIKGKNMLGQEEWIPLNKNKLFGWEKFNRSDYRSVPRGSFQKGGTIPKAQEGGIINKWMYKNMNPTMDIPSNIPGFVSVFNMKEVEPVARAGWAKRLGQPYNKKLLPTNPDGSVRLPDSVARQIETDTVAVKNKYKLYEDIAKSIGPKYSENSKLNAEKNLSLIDSYLNKLREAYKGNEVTVNEYEARKGAFDNQGYLNQETTPLNVLGNFAIKYNPITKRMEYRDTYDFIRGKGNKINFFERVIPGKPFEIRGVVPK